MKKPVSSELFFSPFTVMPWLNSLGRRWKEGPGACSQAPHNRAWQLCYPDQTRWWKALISPSAHSPPWLLPHGAFKLLLASCQHFPVKKETSAFSRKPAQKGTKTHSLGPNASHQAIQTCCSKGLTLRNSTGFTAPPQHSLCTMHWCRW